MLILAIVTFLFRFVFVLSSNSNKNNRTHHNNEEMFGKAYRAMTYSMNDNLKNATAVLHFQGHPLSWYRLDDGVMGGKSSTDIDQMTFHSSGILSFRGNINTDGGGFASIRANLPNDGLPQNTKAIRIKYRGDGKTYKLLLSDGQRSTGGPFSKSPTWQVDLPTEKRDATEPMQESTFSLSQFLPSFGPRGVSEEDKKKLKLKAQEQRLIGLMLSLKLSDGTMNPASTFGEGKFRFNLDIESIEPISDEEL